MTSGWRRLRGDESGAISVLTAAASLVLIASLTLAVDVGSRTLGARELQGAADMAALDAVRSVGDLPSRSAGGLATDSLEQNRDWIEASLSDVQVGTFEPGSGFSPGATPADAVRVVAAGDAPGFVLLDDGALTRSAVARLVPPVATVSVGSRLASVDSNDSPVLNALFGGLLGGNVSLNLVGYQGLANGSVTLRALQQQLLSAGYEVGTVDALLNTDIAVADLLEESATVLSNGSGDQNTIDALTGLQSAVTGSPALQLGDVLEVTTADPRSALDAAVNLFDLVSATAQVADGDNAVSLGLPVSVPGLASGQIDVTLIEPPQIAVGPPAEAVARTAQVRLDLTLELADGSVATLPLSIDAATATATLTDAVCAVPTDTSTATVETVTRTAGLFLGDRSGDTLQPVELIELSVLLSLVTVEGKASVEAAESPANPTGPPRLKTVDPAAAWTVPGVQSVGLSDLLTSENLTVTTSLLGISLDVSDVVSALNTTVAPVFDGVESLVLEPLLEGLGVGLGGADVRVTGLSCHRRQLVE